MTSKVKVNTVETESGSTLTLGKSGDTVTLASGASQSGFGRTGTVDWDTTKKTASFTAVSGTGYFVDTSSSAITLTLPASPSAGDIVSFKDYSYSFATNNLTVARNGSPIGGDSGSNNPVYDTNGTAKTFIYVDSTKGWLVTNESTDTSAAVADSPVVATGGTVTTCGDFKIHTFTSPGTFCVTCAGAGSQGKVSYMVVAGGGGGSAGPGGGGGGAGGFRESKGPLCTYTSSPIAASGGLSVTAQGYPITVGGGGSGGPGGPEACNSGQATSGSNSIFSTITSAGGGNGGAAPSFPSPSSTGGDGGSGGGAYGGNPCGQGSGNTPPVSPPQGSDGSDRYNAASPGAGGGGGGATSSSGNTNADGGTGATTSISSSSTAYSGGGGGGGFGSGCIGASPRSPLGGGNGGTGGGGDGAKGSPTPSPSPNGGAATANTGGGGGGAGRQSSVVNNDGGAGGSGIVIIRYKYQ